MAATSTDNELSSEEDGEIEEMANLCLMAKKEEESSNEDEEVLTFVRMCRDYEIEECWWKVKSISELEMEQRLPP